MVDTIVKEYGQDPFLILVSCLLSLRSKDIVTLPVCRILFQQAQTPEEILAIPLSSLESIVFKLGFYRQKARTLHSVSRDLIQRFGGKVPDSHQKLISIVGVGPKTANLVMGHAFGVPSICVDTHVHRISNRLGLISTRTPEETEMALKKVVPEKYWIELNSLLVMWGQNICAPISPWCSKCALFDMCERKDVKKSR